MIKHINKIAINVLRDRFPDYDWHSNHYNEEYKMIVKALQLAKNNESLHLVVESPQEAFDRGFTVGLNTGKKLVK